MINLPFNRVCLVIKQPSEPVGKNHSAAKFDSQVPTGHITANWFIQVASAVVLVSPPKQSGFRIVAKAFVN